MRLIPVEFGLRSDDPTVPEVALQSVTRHGQTATSVTWRSHLPWPHGSSPAPGTDQDRAEAAAEHAEFATGVQRPWAVDVQAGPAGVTVTVTLTGPHGWHEQATALQDRLVESRADAIATAAWAAWHACGHGKTADEVTGILWLVGSGMPWPRALELAARLAAA